MCGVIGHFKVKCPRVRQRGGGDFVSRAGKVAKVLLVTREILGVAEVAVEEDVIVEGRKKQTLWPTKITVFNLLDRFNA